MPPQSHKSISAGALADLPAAMPVDLAWRFPLQALARAVVQVPGDLRDALSRERGEYRTLWNEASDQSISILARAALPRMMRLREEYASSGYFLDVPPECELAAAVVRDGEGREPLELLRNERSDHIGVAGGDEISDDESASAVDVHEKPRAIGADDRVAFPIANTLSFLNPLRTFPDRTDMLGPTFEKIFRFSVRPAPLAAARKKAVQVVVLPVEPSVDRLMRKAKGVRDLLRRAMQLHELCPDHLLHQGAFLDDPGLIFRAMTFLPRILVCVAREISVVQFLALDLARDCRAVHAQMRGDRRLRVSRFQQGFDRHTILVAEVVMHTAGVARLVIFPSVPRATTCCISD